MKYIKIYTLFLLIGICILSYGIFIFANSETKVVGQQACVDGYRNKNLEGIMCEKTSLHLFDVNLNNSFNMSFLMFSGIVAFGLGLLNMMISVIWIFQEVFE